MGHVYADLPRLRGDQARTHHPPRQARRDDAQDHDDLSHLDARQRADPSDPRRGRRRRARARPVFRHRRRRLDPETQMGLDRAVRSRTRQAGNQGRRHRADRYRLAPQIFRQQGIFRLCAGLEQGRGGMAGQEAGQARRRRYRHRRSSAGDVARPAPQRPANQISAPGIQGGDRPRGDQGFPGMESGAPRVARSRHSDHRKRRRRSRRAQRQALHLPGLSLEMARGRRLRDPARRHARSAAENCRLERRRSRQAVGNKLAGKSARGSQ